MEILVSMVIMCLILIGLANVFISSKRYIMHSRSRAAGGELGSSFLSPLQTNVTYSAWNNGTSDYNNSLQVSNWTGANVTLDKVYTPHYNVSLPNTTLPGYPQVRKVKVNITWPED